MLKVGRINLRIDQRGFRFRVAHKRLELFQGHTAFQSAGGEGVAELVRVDVQLRPLGHLRDDVLD